MHKKFLRTFLIGGWILSIAVVIFNDTPSLACFGDGGDYPRRTPTKQLLLDSLVSRHNFPAIKSWVFAYLHDKDPDNFSAFEPNIDVPCKKDMLQSVVTNAVTELNEEQRRSISHWPLANLGKRWKTINYREYVNYADLKGFTRIWVQNFVEQLLIRATSSTTLDDAMEHLRTQLPAVQASKDAKSRARFDRDWDAENEKLIKHGLQDAPDRNAALGEIMRQEKQLGYQNEALKVLRDIRDMR